MSKNKVPNDYDAYAVLEGTNDVRRNQPNPILTGIQLVENLKCIEQRAPGAIIIPVEIPPQLNNNKVNAETLNITLHQELEDENLPAPILTENILVETDKTIDPKDGYHLTKEGGKLMAEALCDRLKQTHTSNSAAQAAPTPTYTAPESNKKQTLSIEIPQGAMGKVIGKLGANIKRIRNVYPGITEIDEKSNPPTLITDNPDVLEDVKRTIDKHTADTKKRQQIMTNTKTCPFYQAGNCKFGDKCRNIHDTQQGPDPKKPRINPANNYQS